ncbi:MAG: thioredoxin family protein [Clostridia bacterium]|nr:thioredoxin family protein [Clostridia bacterium]
MADYKSQLKGLCVVEISGESCANCLTLMPILKELCAQRGDVKLVHIEADYSTTELMEEWEVTKVPTILLMENGEIFARCAGYQPEEILELWLDSKIEERKQK